MKTKIIFIAILFCGIFCFAESSQAATTYYVASTGNDNNDGSAGAPWRTIQKCADNAIAGDTCNIAAGVYGSSGNPTTIASKASGSAGNLITFQGAGASSTTLWGSWSITHNYNKVTGFKIDSKDIGYYEYTVYISGDYNQIISNTITSTKVADSTTYTGGIQLTTTSSYATAQNNLISNHNYLALLVEGDHHTFSGNEWTGRPTFNTEDPGNPGHTCEYNAYDRAYIFATYYTEDGEIIHDWDGGNCWGGTPHMDIWQSFSDAGVESGNIVIKNDIIYDLTGDLQLCNFGGIGEHLHDWTWYNNVMYNIEHGTCNVYEGARMRFYNNLFYNVGYVSGGMVIGYATTPNYGATEGEIYNNMFIGCGRPDVESWAGYYAMDSGTGTADYNYVTRSAANNYGAKTGSNVGGTHGINGGDPKFTSIVTPDFHIGATSPARDAGTSLSGAFTTDILGVSRPQGSAWDIGPYEYTGTVQTCSQLSGTCCSSVQTCTGSFQSSSDCGSLCCIGACQAPAQTCPDGTSYSQCSSTKPLYCSSGTLTNNCQACGCPTGQSCQSGGTCQSSSQYFLPEQYVEAESGTLASPMQAGSNTSASGGQHIYTPTSYQGSASFTFQIGSPGKYKMEARVLNYGTPLDAHDSFYVGLDSEPAQGNDNYTYDTLSTAVFAWDNVSLRGPTGNFSWAEFDPMLWDLSQGTHTFTFYGRESNTWLDQIILRRACIHKSDSSCDGCVSDPELFAFIDRWKVDSSNPSLRELIEAIGLWKRGCQ